MVSVLWPCMFVNMMINYWLSSIPLLALKCSINLKHVLYMLSWFQNWSLWLLYRSVLNFWKWQTITPWVKEWVKLLSYPRHFWGFYIPKSKWMFPKIVVPQNGWFIMENPIKMDDLGVPLFSEPPKYQNVQEPIRLAVTCFQDFTYSMPDFQQGWWPLQAWHHSRSRETLRGLGWVNWSVDLVPRMHQAVVLNNVDGLTFLVADLIAWHGGIWLLIYRW